MLTAAWLVALLRAGTEQSVKEKMKVQTKIIEAMFECLFRVLKNFKDGIEEAGEEGLSSKKFSWPLLSSALSSLAKYCVHINIDFMRDHFNWLYAIASGSAVPKAQKFQCLNAVYQILDGPGKVGLDPLVLPASYDVEICRQERC